MVGQDGIITITDYDDRVTVGSGCKIRGTELTDNHTSVGIHLICGGIVVCRHVSDTFQTLICRDCNLRVSFPRTVKNFKELILYFRLKYVSE